MKRKPQPLPEMVTARQAAVRKRVAESAVRKALADGRLSGQKMGTVWMIRVDDLDAWKVERGPARDPILELHNAIRAAAHRKGDPVARLIDTSSPELIWETIPEEIWEALPADVRGDRSEETARALAKVFRERFTHPARRVGQQQGLKQA